VECKNKGDNGNSTDMRKHNLNQIRIWDFRTMTLCRWRLFGRLGAFIPQLQDARYMIFETVVLNELADRMFCVLVLVTGTFISTSNILPYAIELRSRDNLSIKKL